MSAIAAAVCAVSIPAVVSELCDAMLNALLRAAAAAVQARVAVCCTMHARSQRLSPCTNDAWRMPIPSTPATCCKCHLSTTVHSVRSVLCSCAVQRTGQLPCPCCCCSSAQVVAAVVVAAVVVAAAVAIASGAVCVVCDGCVLLWPLSRPPFTEHRCVAECVEIRSGKEQ